jgi:hypothetical protein
MFDQRFNKAQKTILLLFVAVVLATPIAITVAVRKTIASMIRTGPASSTSAVDRSRATGESDAERQAKAWKAYNDYEYVKRTGPITGPMYSTKW